MSEPVKPAPSRRSARTHATERQILEAAHRLFIERGWAGTTLADVAAAADVAERTVYIRFGTKGALLQRVIGAAVVGDAEPVPVRDRSWYQQALTATTLDARIDAYVTGAAELMRRAAPVIAVALHAMGSDASLAEAAIAGHAGTRDDIRAIWHQAHADGLLPSDIDPNWLADTMAIIGQADVYLLGHETLGWTVNKYESWLRVTLRHLLASAHRQRPSHA